MRIAGIDPGGTTGLVIVEEPMKIIAFHEEKKMDNILSWLTQQQPDEVVCEEYQIYPDKAKAQSWKNPPSPQVIGAVKVWCNIAGVPFVSQGAAQRKRITHNILKTANLFTPGQTHITDALCHALYRLWFAHGYYKDPAVTELFASALKPAEEIISPLKKSEVIKRMAQVKKGLYAWKHADRAKQREQDEKTK